MKNILIPLKNAALITLVMLLLCGFLYPLLVTGVGQVIFPSQANGSLVKVDGKAVGSSIVGQDFTSPFLMKCRPSAVGYNTYTAEEKESGDYTGVGSGSNNYAATNPALVERVQADMEAFLALNPDVKKEDIPTDLLTASGSGLDPHISPASAEVQLPAIAAASGLSIDALRDIVKEHTSGKVLGIFGENTVNVLLVNLDITAAMAK